MNIAKKCMSEWINWITDDDCLFQSLSSMYGIHHSLHCMHCSTWKTCVVVVLRISVEEDGWGRRCKTAIEDQNICRVFPTDLCQCNAPPSLIWRLNHSWPERAEIEYWILKTGGAPRANIDWISFHLNPSRKLQETWWYKVTWSVSSSLPDWPW